MKSRIEKNALSVVVVIIAFVGVIAVKYWIQDYREREAASKAEKTLEQLQADATKSHPDMPLSLATREEAIKKASKMLTSEADELKRATSAAAMFWGFLFVNTRERLEFCREQGVEIQPFVKAFELAHASEIVKARSIFSRASADTEKLYTSIKPQLHTAIVQDMNDIATSNKISIKEGCQMLSDNADALVHEMHLSKTQPMVFKVLTNAK